MNWISDLLKKETLFQKIFEESNRPVVISSLEGKYLYVNNIYIEMRRCTKEFLINKFWWESFSNGELARRVKNTHTEISKKRECSYNAGYNIGIEDSMIIDWQSKIIYSEEFKSDVIVEYGRDVSEKMKLKSQLIRMKKLDNLGTLAGGIAREYNNIHTELLGHLSLLKNLVKKRKKELRVLEKTQSLSIDAIKLTSKLLSFAKKNMCSDQILDPNVILHDVYNIILKTISWKINVKIDLVKSKNYILADYDQVFQSIMNLVVNATDSMKDEGEITLSTSTNSFYEDQTFSDEGFTIKKGEYFSISVKDTGQGMEKNTRKKIFEPFFTTKDKDNNEGIGMPLVYCVVKSHNGYLFVNSEINKGTVVALLFPIVLTEYNDPILNKNLLLPLIEIETNKKIILISKDQQLNCMETILVKYGYNIKRISNIEEALKISSSDEHIDLVILDLSIIEPYNIETISKLKSNNTEIIIITDSVDEEKINDLNQYKINCLLFKPFKVSHLIKILKNIL